MSIPAPTLHLVQSDHPADEALIQDVANYLRRHKRNMRPGDLVAPKIGMSNNGRLVFHGAAITDNNPMREE